MLLRKAIEEISGLRYVIDKLEIQSGLAKRILYDSPYLVSKEEIEAKLDKVEIMRRYLLDVSLQKAFSELSIKLGQLRDIRGTISNLEKRQVLGDVELFELKSFALLSAEINTILNDNDVDIIKIPDLENVIGILDPDNTRIPHFYIYDSYSPQLAELRKSIERLNRQPDGESGNADKLYFQSVAIEDEIRERLSGELYEYKEDILKALLNIAELDILIAKANQSIEMKLCKPVISTGIFSFKGIFNPYIQDILNKSNRHFQPVDIGIRKAPTLITGANMAGKTIMLKTVALAQALFQFGFYVPVEAAQMAIVEEIVLIIGDEQSEAKGLSSFAAEMLNIDRVIKTARNQKILALIDEPARTTNPEEGKAIVSALAEMLNQYHVLSMVTTHYSGLQLTVRRLRVKGLMEDKIDSKLSVQNINRLIEYTLIEDKEENVPHEALRIAEILNVDEELINKAHLFLNANDTEK